MHKTYNFKSKTFKFPLKNTNISISDTHLSLHLKHNLETNMVTFEKSANHMSGGISNINYKDYYDVRNVRNNEDYVRDRSRYYNNRSNNRVQYNPYLSAEDFEQTSLNKYEIEVYIELTNKKLTENETNCYMKKRKMIYNTKELFSSEKLFDFTKISNSELYDPSMDLSKIRPYLDLSYNTKISDKQDKDKDKKENKDKKDKD